MWILHSLSSVRHTGCIPCVTEAHIEYRPFKNLHDPLFYPHEASNLAQPRIPHHHRHNLVQRRRRIRVRHTRQTPHLRNILRISAKVINYTPQSAPSPHSTPPHPLSRSIQQTLTLLIRKPIRLIVPVRRAIGTILRDDHAVRRDALRHVAKHVVLDERLRARARVDGLREDVLVVVVVDVCEAEAQRGRACGEVLPEVVVVGDVVELDDPGGGGTPPALPPLLPFPFPLLPP